MPTGESNAGAPAAAKGAFRQVGRAVADVRRGVPVAVLDGGAGCLVVATELADEETIAALEEAGAGRAGIALSAHRARVLNIAPTGRDAVVLAPPPHLNTAGLCGLADPMTDLDNPLRGPFEVESDPWPGSTAALTLCKLARLIPAVLLVRVPTGSARELADWAARHDILVVQADDVAAHENDSALTLRAVTSAQVPLAGAENTRLIAFRPADGGVEHVAIVVGDPDRSQPVLTRLHSECFTGDLLESLRCDCGQQLRGAIVLMAEQGSGVLIYLAQEGRGIGLINKLRAYRLQDQGFDTVDANERLGFEADERIFLPAAQMLRALGYDRVRLLTNNPEKVEGLERHGIIVAERVPHAFPPNNHNERYLRTKALRRGHKL
ncbi:MAG: GTP cyclohydrolase II [Proteobacteria bacterium]|nr:GTP cyclohydrolase II [Pseudomonadota bacterium]